MNYNWNLKDAVFTKDKGKVFSCFSCGGGSTMGYKLAGYDVIGAVDIDPKMMEIYRANHNPKYSYVESVADFKNREDLPSELYELDILDGSPPCSSFSMAGNREKDWGKKKKFREGQAEQELDRLFFDFIDLAKRLQPKVVLAENVKGILQGNAKKYVTEIYKELDLAGYEVQHFLLDASKMGVPQRRERVFFIAIRKDLASKFHNQVDLFLTRAELNLDFNEKPILFKDIFLKTAIRNTPPPSLKIHFDSMDHKGASYNTPNGTRFGFFQAVLYDKVAPTMTSESYNRWTLQDKFELVTDKELISISSFPKDFNFLDSKPCYVMGMSVPPLMTSKISKEIYDQWLSKL